MTTFPKSPETGDDALWIQRYRTPVVLWNALATANPQRGVISSNESGIYQLYAWDVTTGARRQLTDHADGKVFGTISPDGRYIYYFEDTSGNEIGHYVRVPFEGGEPENITPDMPLYASFFLDISHNNTLLGLTVANQNGFQIYLAPVDAAGDVGPARLLHQGGRLMVGPLLSYDGDIAVVQTTERTGNINYGLFAFDTASGEQIGELSEGTDSSVEMSLFCRLPGDSRLLATSNQTGDKRPLIWNPRTGERTDLTLDGLEGEVMPVDWSPDGNRLLLVQFSQAVQQFYIYDLASDTLKRLDHPGGSYGFHSTGIYFVSDDEIYARWSDSTHLPRLVALDADSGAIKRTVLEVAETPPSRGLRSVTFASSDGQLIQGWLGVPDGEGPFPTILETHGGPTAVETEDFSLGAQVWLDHGFAFLSINYRGSVTFGKEFQNKIVGDLGHWEVEDMVAARAWLIDNGIALADQILLTGWSYGGYLTLQALGTYPDLWAGGLAGIAIADWSIQYEDTAATLRGYQVAMLGGTPDDVPEQYAASSPITYAEQVKAPVYIIQGRNDTRTPARPVEVYEAKMKALGKDIEVHWFDSGHMGAWTDTEQNIDHAKRFLEQAYRMLDAPAK